MGAKELIFWSPYKEFRINYIKSRHVIDKWGNATYQGGKQLLFQNVHDGSVYRTSVADEIEFIEHTASFEDGTVKIVDSVSTKAGKEPVRVVSGTRSTQDIAPKAPAEPVREPVAAVTVPKKRSKARVPA